MDAIVKKWGNSLGVRIPAFIAARAGIEDGTPISLEVNDDTITIRRKKYNLQDLLCQINNDNLHREVKTGSPAGKEIW